ncbi:ABC transporter ATP-binding protein (plasmid) [Rhizobium leguminosarum]
MSGVSIEIQELSKSYGAIKVVDRVSLEVGPGEFVALLGPSGSGKTTLLMSIAGFVNPDSGRILIDGSDVTTAEPRLRNIGMVFQNYALFPHMTVHQNIAFPLVQRGVGKQEIARRIGKITELTGLAGMEERPIPNLSGGQQQRVALARALVYEPRVLLMDEPLGALDKKLREHLQEEIKRIQQVTGTTVVFVTHDQSEALGMADRLVVFNKGRIEQLGTPAELYDAPATAFVADFIGEANILRGMAVQVTRDECSIRLSNGHVVEGCAVGADKPAVGNAVELVVRPSRVETSPSSASGLQGRIISRSYLGDAVNLRVEIDGVQSLAVREPPSSTWVPGQTISLNWKSRDARIFKANERGM